jgi:hypothetical protein
MRTGSPVAEGLGINKQQTFTTTNEKEKQKQITRGGKKINKKAQPKERVIVEIEAREELVLAVIELLLVLHDSPNELIRAREPLLKDGELLQDLLGVCWGVPGLEQAVQLSHRRGLDGLACGIAVPWEER